MQKKLSAKDFLEQRKAQSAKQDIVSTATMENTAEQDAANDPHIAEKPNMNPTPAIGKKKQKP
jgi:hypothetical protein